MATSRPARWKTRAAPRRSRRPRGSAGGGGAGIGEHGGADQIADMPDQLLGRQSKAAVERRAGPVAAPALRAGQPVQQFAPGELLPSPSPLGGRRDRPPRRGAEEDPEGRSQQ